MTLDPREGITDAGFITTGADRAHIAFPYRALIEDCRDRLAGDLGSALVSLFVYGSVATGQARLPRSDLDLLAVVVDTTTAVAEIARALSVKHKETVREVGLATIGLPAVFEPSAEGLGLRAFIHHYCVHVSGRDLRLEFGPFKANAEMAWAFNGDVGKVVGSEVAALRENSDPARAARIGRSSARKLLLAGASLVSARDGIWTTDRGTAACRLRVLYPNQATSVDKLLSWSESCEADNDEVVSVIVSCRDWIATELAKATAGE